MKKLEDIEPFAIDCRSFCKGDIQMIVDKMLSVGIKKHDTPDEYDWGEYPYWGYNKKYGTYTGDIITTTGWMRSAALITLDQLDEHLGLKAEITDLRNTKIDLRKEDGTVNEELSRAFQEAVFELGGSWRLTKEEARFTDEPFLFVDTDLRLTHCNCDIDFFERHKNKQIKFSYERKLEWKAEFLEDKAEKQVIELPNGDKYYTEDLQEALSKIKKIEE